MSGSRLRWSRSTTGTTDDIVYQYHRRLLSSKLPSSITRSVAPRSKKVDRIPCMNGSVTTFNRFMRTPRLCLSAARAADRRGSRRTADGANPPRSSDRHGFTRASSPVKRKSRNWRVFLAYVFPRSIPLLFNLGVSWKGRVRNHDQSPFRIQLQPRGPFPHATNDPQRRRIPRRNERWLTSFGEKRSLLH